MTSRMLAQQHLGSIHGITLKHTTHDSHTSVHVLHRVGSLSNQVTILVKQPIGKVSREDGRRPTILVELGQGPWPTRQRDYATTAVWVRR